MVGTFLLIFTLLLLVALAFQARWANREGTWDTYLVKRGRHYSRKVGSLWPLRYFVTLAPRRMDFVVIFGDGCTTPPPEDDVSKLYGMTLGFDPEYRSLRVGWRPSPTHPGFVDLFAYWHEAGQRGMAPLGVVAPYEEVRLSVTHDGKAGLVGLRTAPDAPWAYVTCPVSGASAWLRFKLFVYYGGTVTAPCDVKIYVKNL